MKLSFLFFFVFTYVSCVIVTALPGFTVVVVYFPLRAVKNLSKNKVLIETGSQACAVFKFVFVPLAGF